MVRVLKTQTIQSIGYILVLYAGYNNYKLDGILIISKTVEIIEFRAFNLCCQWDQVTENVST